LNVVKTTGNLKLANLLRNAATPQGPHEQ